VTTYRAGFLYSFYAAATPVTILVFVVLAGWRVQGLSGLGLFALVAGCVAVGVGALARSSVCGIEIDGSQCKVRRMWTSSSYDLARCVVLPPQATLAGKATLVPAVRLSDGRKVVFSVLSGARQSTLWSFDTKLIELASADVT